MNDSIIVRTWKTPLNAAKDIDEQGFKLSDSTDIEVTSDSQVVDSTDFRSEFETTLARRQEYVITVTRVSTYIADSITIESKEPANG